MRSQFDQQLAQLHRELIEMGALCEEVIALSSQALTEGDASLARRVAPLDRDIDRKERDIENLCLRLLTADGTLRAMARAAIRMVSESVDAYVRQDVALAERVIASDDEVDEDFERIKRRLIDGISSGTEDGESVLDLVMIAKYYERIADHATNIAEWVEFSVTGVHKTEIT